jgi:coenzyme F420 hydrogenase subunit beta
MNEARGRDELKYRVEQVVDRGNCSGCGACALVSERVTMGLSEAGYMRPNVGPIIPLESAKSSAKLFQASCPGVGLRARSAPEDQYDPIFGSFVSVWRASAVDPEVRLHGSSGGVLTALSAWMVETGQVKSAVGSSGDTANKSRSVPVRIMSRQEAIAASGSRYAPVSNATLFTPGAEDEVFVGKPCEVSAVYQLQEAMGIEQEIRPILLSFFCAGTPSQHATDALLNELGTSPDLVEKVRYRGMGWPGNFVATSLDGIESGVSYDVAWSKHLGPTIQWRCKICPDGTGGHADVAVGDFWESDERGYPLFEDAPGNSIAIARTARGHRLLLEAMKAGVLTLEPANLADVSRVQPSQVLRRKTLIGRIGGALVAGKRVPRYIGYRSAALAARTPFAAFKAGVGTFLRLTKAKRVRSLDGTATRPASRKVPCRVRKANQR